MLAATDGADFLRDFLDPVDAHLLAWPTLRTHSLSFVSERCQTCLSLLSLLQPTADVRWMAIEKRGDLRGEITLLQYCFADESIASIYHTPQSGLAK